MTKASRTGPKALPETLRVDPAVLQWLASTTLLQKLELSSETLNPTLNQAMALEQQGAWSEALALYARLGLLDPERLDVQLGIARSATQLGEHAIAVKAAACAIVLAPDDPRGYLLSGRNCLMMGQYEEAREDLQDALRLARGDAGIESEASGLLAQIDARRAS